MNEKQSSRNNGCWTPKKERRKKITLKNEEKERKQDGGKAGHGVHFFPQVYKNTSSNVEDLGSIPGLERPSGWENSQKREQLPTAVFWPGEFHEHRRLVGYSPWGRKELDKTEQLSLSLFTSEIILPGKASVAHVSNSLQPHRL